jgi:UDP-N-acetylmuramoylalanine--D-glutamate ligase
MTISDLSCARVAIWGTGGEGIAALGAIRSRLPGKELVILEEAPDVFPPDWILLDQKISLKRGCVTLALLKEFDVIIRSPGVSIYREEIIAAREAGVTFTSGTNLWFAENPGAHAICVTGSKGKSTTTHLICHLLNSLGVPAAMAGNIGCPLLSSDLSKDKAVYVIELSSYQLSDFTGAPGIAVLLNLYPEHLDWHKGEETYFKDKTRLLSNAVQSRIVNQLDPRTAKYIGHLSRLVYFNSGDGFHHDGAMVYRRGEPWLALREIQLLGGHNLSNVCAALTAVAEYGIGLERERIAAALRQFKGLSHRLSRLGESNGILYVNDSIATIPQATIAALKCFAGRDITLLAGGYDRGLNQSEFAGMIYRESPFAVITLPGTGCVLSRELRSLVSDVPGPQRPSIHEAADLDRAVSIARNITPAGGVVLLSPGAPSFNSHRNFAERGKAFAKAAGFQI